MALGLRAMNSMAGSKLLDKLGLRKPGERMVYQAVRAGFSTLGAVGRGIKATRKLLRPARLSAAQGGEQFDLTPSAEQQMLFDSVRGFALEQLRPAATAADAAACAPPGLLQQGADLGLAQIGIPEELGGAGSERSPLTGVLVAEALAQGDMGLALACLAPTAVSTALVLWGNEQQQLAWLPAFAGDQPPAAALAILEPRALFDPLALRTTAREVRGGYVLDGVKSLVPCAANATLFIVAAELEGKGPALFLVEAGSKGLRIEAEPAMGLRAAATGRLNLRKLALPAGALLGAATPETYSQCVALARLGWCALAVGTAQAVLDYVIPYVNDRVAFGEPVSHRQSVAFAIANMGIELNAMRLLTWRAASLAERGEDFVQATALARRLCADKGMQIGNDGVQLLGGHGFTREHPVERWYRDLRAAGLMEGAILV